MRLGVRRNVVVGAGKRARTEPPRPTVACFQLDLEQDVALNTQANLARWTAATGDQGAARDQLTALLSIQGKILGPEHPDSLTTRANLALWTGDAGTRPEPATS